ncbi:MAG: ATP-dependent protease subunit HslV [Firmicutes bacterium]|jgi:ATP-dependent HslUV protease subunit HslV|nr:ATP-dependent protease subunit HslV [Bacillota bacterium]NLL88100.1 ATP-dependent protease subunit HslV [Bacillota bacterium]
MEPFKATTIIAVRRDGKTAMAGDGQVTFGENTIIKHRAKKIRKLYNNSVLVGFAGAAADAFTLFQRFEGKLEEFHGHLERAAVELVKEWRTDRAIRNLEALIIAADAEKILLISGSGDIIEPDQDVIAIGSGGGYALAAAKALLAYSGLPAAEIAREALGIAAGICVYTNDQIYVVELTSEKEAAGDGVDS